MTNFNTWKELFCWENFVRYRK